MVHSVLLSVPNLIDLAVGPPELNTGLLNVLLHIIASHINVQGTRIQLSTNQPIQLTNNQTNFEDNTKQFTVVNSKPDVELDIKTAKLVPYKSERQHAVNKLIIIENTFELCPLFPHKQVLLDNSLPTTADLLEVTGTDGGNTLITMFDLLNMTKRIEATEMSIEKLIQLLCDLNTKYTESKEKDQLAGQKKLSDYDGQLKDVRNLLKTLKEDMMVCNATMQDIVKENNQNCESNLEERVANLERRELFSKSADKQNTHNQTDIGNFEFGEHKDEIKTFKHDFSATTLTSKSSKINCEHQLDEQSAALNDLKLDFENFRHKVTQEICGLQEQVVDMALSVNNLIESSNFFREKLQDFTNTFEEIRQNLYGLNEDVNMLVQERIDRRLQYEALIDQIESVKCIKADREEVEVMINLKADIVEMDKKVPYVEFQDIFNDFSLIHIDLFEKIIEVDFGWNQAIEGVYDTLALKVDVVKADQMANRTLDRMIALKDKLREFGMFRLSCESAATVQKYVKDVKCIACNAQTYMNTELGLPEIPRLGKFGEKLTDHTTNVSRELARITVPCTKRIEIGGTTEVKRFCGGINTRIEAAERRSVKGNFITQTGAVPFGLNDAEERMQLGTDGVLYRVDKNECICR